MKFTIYMYPLLLALSLIACRKDTKVTTIDDQCMFVTSKMNGVSFENVSYAIDQSHVKPIANAEANWVTTMPFGYLLTNDDSVHYNSNFQWYGEKREGVIEIVNLCHEQKINVMIKPHLWIVDGRWVGDLSFETNEEWENFESSYITYITDFAGIAQTTGAEAFCIGVEMRNVVKERPDFFITLIDTVRSIYKGKITYAANWDNYQNVTFWDKLDYIGVDAYFPVSEQKTPLVESCYAGWEKDFEALKTVSSTHNKQVLFTEFGYRNVDFTGKEPWNEEQKSTYNSTGQINAYRALFCRFWTQDWFAGGFLWKWHPGHDNAGGEKNNRFTPQNKPVMELISEVYKATN